jgi:hypothetical protein
VYALYVRSSRLMSFFVVYDVTLLMVRPRDKEGQEGVLGVGRYCVVQICRMILEDVWIA